MRNSWLLLVGAICTGCGGAVDTGLLDGGSNDGSAGGNDGATGGDAADKCAQLIALADQALQAAIQCCPTCNVMQ